jgi:hypothetical protein
LREDIVRVRGSIKVYIRVYNFLVKTVLRLE